MTTIRFAVRIVTLLLAVIVVSGSAAAQYRSSHYPAPPPSVLSPDPSPWWIGPQLGAGINSHGGDFITDFCDCGFEDGSGYGFAIGIEAGHFLSSSVAVAVKLVYNDYRADYATPVTEEAYIFELDTDVPDVQFERQMTVNISYLMLHPVVELYPFPWLYLFAGPAVGVSATAEQEYVKVLTDERFLYGLGEPESHVVTKDSGEIPRVESFRADLRAGIGANLRIGRNLVFSPEVSYGYPLTTISDDDNWSASAIHVMGVLKIEL